MHVPSRGAHADNSSHPQPLGEFHVQRPGARQILQALVEGIDPLTGDELPSGSVLQQAEVMRALLAGIAALEAGAARAQRRAQLPKNVGRPWSPDEEITLISGFHSGQSVADLARKHGRTLTAIEARLEKLGLVSEKDRVTQNRFINERRAAQRARLDRDDDEEDEEEYEDSEQSDLEDSLDDDEESQA